MSGEKRHPSLWRNRDYLLLWSGQGVSTIGTGVTQLALPLLVLALTGSPAQAGLVNAAATVPYIVFGLVAGAFVDRWNRKVVMVLCDAGRALNLASIPLAGLAGHLSVVQLYGVAAIEGTLYLFFSLAEAACLPRVVNGEQLTAANAQNRITFDVANLVGPPLGGALFQLGRTVPFLADVASFCVSVISLLFIRTRFQGERSAGRQKLRAEIAEGLRFLWGTPVLRFMAFINGGIGFTLHGVPLIVIVLAKQQHAPASVIGIIFSVAAIGGIAGALLTPRVERRLGFGQVIIGVLWIWALLVPLYAVAPNPLALGVVGAGVLVFDPLYDVVQFSYRLALIPDELQGRVNSVFRLIAWGMRPVGIALTGFLLQYLGTSRTVLFFAACLVVLAISASLNVHIRSARPIAEMGGV